MSGTGLLIAMKSHALFLGCCWADSDRANQCGYVVSTFNKNVDPIVEELGDDVIIPIPPPENPIISSRLDRELCRLQTDGENPPIAGAYTKLSMLSSNTNVMLIWTYCWVL